MPLIVPELEWMVVGESISFKNILYQDVWDDVAPLSALTYALIDTLVGRSQWSYQIIAMLLVFMQCYLFNQLLKSNKAYKENTYVPALIYAILMGTFFDFFTLSPVLMSGAFLLVVINGIFHHIAVKVKDERFLNMGLALGLSVLFYLPALIFLPISIITLGLYSSMNLKKYILLFFGFIFPVILVGIFFFWHGALLEFLDYYFFSWISMPAKELVSAKSLMYISLVPGILLFFSWFMIYSAKRYNNQQTNFMLVMMLFFTAAGFVISFVKDRAPYQLIIFVIPVSFFLSHLFLLIKRRFLSEIFFLSFFALTMVVNFGTLNNFTVSRQFINYDQLLVSTTPWDQVVYGKKVLIIGEDLDAYQHAQLATPYFNWNLSKRHLNQLSSYNNLSVVYDNFLRDMPEVIIDQKQVVPLLFQYMPTVASHYQKTAEGNAYVLNSSN